jgi:hypothetical protein
MRSAGFAAALSFALHGCASDDLVPPEPELQDPGAFVAVETGTGELELHRTLDSLIVGGETIFFLTIYDVAPGSWEEARAIARRRDIPVRLPVATASAKLYPAAPYRVVWYRTLTDEERERLQ